MHPNHSEEEARHKIYSVSTRCYYAFGALVSEELSYKLKGASASNCLGCYSLDIWVCSLIFFIKFFQNCQKSAGYYPIHTWMLRTKIMEVRICLLLQVTFAKTKLCKAFELVKFLATSSSTWCDQLRLNSI